MKKSFGSRSIIYPVPVWLVGSYDKNSKPNLMTATWAGMVSGHPPALAISLRKERYTYQNIITTNCFTINIPSQKYIKEADFCGITSGKDIDKFKATGLTPKTANKVNAPYVDEFPMILECKIIHKHEVGLYTQFIGEIVDTIIDDSILNDQEMPDMTKLNPILYTAGNKLYHGVNNNIANAYEIGKIILSNNKIKTTS